MRFFLKFMFVTGILVFLAIFTVWGLAAIGLVPLWGAEYAALPWLQRAPVAIVAAAAGLAIAILAAKTWQATWGEEIRRQRAERRRQRHLKL